jgi:hypothetical protein
MNPEAFDRFSRAYRAGLRTAVTSNPADYAIHDGEAAEEYAARCADKMLQAISDNPSSVNYDGDGFKRACRALGIKYTRKAIWEYLQVTP